MQIYVGNISYRTTEEGLKELFGNYGEVEAVKIITDRDTGRSKGFGFITMDDDSAANSAIDGLDGKEFEGRTLRVNKARPKEERPRNFNNRY